MYAGYYLEQFLYSYGFVCIYIVLHVYLSLSYLKIIIGDVTLVETKASSKLIFFYKFHVNNFLTAVKINI